MRPLFRGQALSYPGGMPSIDPSHPAAAGMSPGLSFSGVASVPGFYDILQGRVPTTMPGSVTVKGFTGPTWNFAGVTTYQITFAGQSTASYSKATIAAIIFPTSFTVTKGVFASSTSTSKGCILQISGTGNPLMNIGATSVTFSAITLVANHPYFVAVSAIVGGVSVCVAIDLSNGEMQSSSSTNSASSIGTPTGTITIGQNGDDGALVGGIAAVMFAPSFMPLSALEQWAQRPWDFWYPPAIDELLFSGLGVASSGPAIVFGYASSMAAGFAALSSPTGRGMLNAEASAITSSRVSLSGSVAGAAVGSARTAGLTNSSAKGVLSAFSRSIASSSTGLSGKGFLASRATAMAAATVVGKARGALRGVSAAMAGGFAVATGRGHLIASGAAVASSRARAVAYLFGAAERIVVASSRAPAPLAAPGDRKLGHTAGSLSAPTGIGALGVATSASALAQYIRGRDGAKIVGRSGSVMVGRDSVPIIGRNGATRIIGPSDGSGHIKGKP